MLGPDSNASRVNFYDYPRNIELFNFSAAELAGQVIPDEQV